MNTQSHSLAEHHFEQAERTLSALGSLGADEYEATRETAVALVHAVLAVAAILGRKNGNRS